MQSFCPASQRGNYPGSEIRPAHLFCADLTEGLRSIPQKRAGISIRIARPGPANLFSFNFGCPRCLRTLGFFGRESIGVPPSGRHVGYREKGQAFDSAISIVKLFGTAILRIAESKA